MAKEITVKLPTGVVLRSCDCDVVETDDAITVSVGWIAFAEVLAEHYAKMVETLEGSKASGDSPE